MKNKKSILVLISALTVLTLVLGIVGLLESKKGNSKPIEVNYSVIYRYYLNDVEVEQMPLNSTLVSSSQVSTLSSPEKMYSFSTATCTNKVTYKWDEASWTFKTDNTADTTCKLYFVTTTNKITIKATNAIVTPLKSDKIKRGEDAVISINPTEGYKYEKVTCSNEEVVEWNEDKNELTVRDIYKDTTCDVSFAISKLSIEVKVNNGSGATKVEYNYGNNGKPVEINISASNGYGTPEITCTNKQIAAWSSGVLKIDKITDNTVCTVNFQLLEQHSYKVKMDAGANATLSSANNSISEVDVKAKGSVAFTIKPKAGYAFDSVSCTSGGKIVTNTDTANNTATVTISDITSNIECSVSTKASVSTQED